jgi:trimethylamine---corrinoid protein Co-methyltransferase
MKGYPEFTIRPTLQVMSAVQVESFVAAAMEVLETTGIKVMHPEAVELLERIGAKRGQGDVVRLKPGLVQAAMISAPKRLAIYDRNGEPAMTLGGGHSGGSSTYFGTGSDLKWTYDLITGELRTTVAQDIADMARVVDYLPDMDFMMSYGIPSDVPAQRVYRTEFVQMVANSTKPIVFTSDNGLEARLIVEMAATVVGGLDRLRERPFVLAYSQPTSPLQHSQDALGKLLACAELGIPVCYPPGMMPGATAPCTLAGAITQSLAEALSALVIHQAKCPGGGIVLCGAHGCFDMRTSINVYAAPERLMTQAALAAIYQHYGLPTWGFGGCTDAHVMDEQAGAEFGLLTLWALLSGINLAHDTGYLGSGMIGDLRAIVHNNEIHSYVRHLLVRGVPVNDDTRALSAISAVGPGGQFLGSDHTFNHFRSELWFPSLSNRLNLTAWQSAGSTSMGVRLGEKVREILRTHQPVPLNGKTLERLLAMVQA